MSFVAVGHNTFSSIYDYENEEISWFGKKVKCPLELWRDLNKYSHYNLYDWSHVRNDSYLDIQINKVISIIKEIGFDLKENSKPYTSEIGFNSKIS